MDRKMIGALGLAALAALGAGCFRNEISEIELNIPAMRTAACGQAVQAAVARLGEGAILDIQIDVPARKAQVKYNNVRLGRRNVEVAVRNAGFDVNDLPANEEARAKLPPECQGRE